MILPPLVFPGVILYGQGVDIVGNKREGRENEGMRKVSERQRVAEKGLLHRS